VTAVDADRRYLLDRLRQEAGLAIEPAQAYLLDFRLQPLLRRHGLPSVAALVARLRLGGAGLGQEVVDALCTNETSFFRNEEVFDTLASSVLPGLVEARRATRALTIWCAACSSGQEVWSVAMTIRDRVPALRDWRLRILATDVSQAMVDRTRAAEYTDAELARGLPERLRNTYFVRRGAAWQVRAELQAIVEVRRANLLDPRLEVGTVDLALLRNVLIYFDPDGKRRVFDLMIRSLASDGRLLIGAGEQLLDPRFAGQQVGATFVYGRAPGPTGPVDRR
jgi:chemotaxis protein methyltransferase CheR